MAKEKVVLTPAEIQAKNLKNARVNAGISAAAGIGSQVAGALDNTPDQIDGADYAKNALSMAGTGAAFGPIGAGVGAVVGIGITALQAQKQKEQQKEQLGVLGLAQGQAQAGMQVMADGGPVLAEPINEGALYDPNVLKAKIQAIKAGPVAPQQFANGGPINPNIKLGRAIVNKKAEGGEVQGPGTGTSDDIEVKLNQGDFVVPAMNAPIAQQLRDMYLGDGGKITPGQKKGDVPTALSNGEHVFTKAEADHLQSNGINLDMLAPNADKTGYGRYKGGKILKKTGGVPKNGTLSDGLQMLAKGGIVKPSPLSQYEQLIVDTAAQHGIKDKKSIAYLLAIADKESDMGKNMTEIDSGKAGNNKNYAETQYIGRGFVQLTHEENYKKATDYFKSIGKDYDLVANPELANDPKIAAEILVEGTRSGWFTGKKLSDVVDSENASDVYKIINPGATQEMKDKFTEYYNKRNSSDSEYVPSQKSQTKQQRFNNDADKRGIPGTLGGVEKRVTNQPFHNLAEKQIIDIADEDVRPSIEGAQIPTSKMSTSSKNDPKLKDYGKDGPGSGLIAKNGKVFSKDYVDMIKTHPEYFKAQNEKELLDAVNNKKPKSIEDWNAVFARARALTGRDIDPNNPEGSFDDVLNSNKPIAQLIRMRRNEVNDGVNNGTENDKKDELNRLAQTKSEYKNSPLLTAADKTTPIVKPVTVDTNQNEPLPKPEEIQSPTDQAWAAKGENPNGPVEKAMPVNVKEIQSPAPPVEIQSKSSAVAPAEVAADTSKHDAEMNMFDKLGAYGGLFALGQTAFGIAGLLSDKDPGTYKANPIAATEYEKAKLDATRIDPAVRANAETNFELTRRTRNAEADKMAAGDTGLALAASRESAIDKNRGIIGLAAQEEGVLNQKKQFAASRGDAVINEQSKQWQSQNDRFVMNQQAAGQLLNTGITNFIGATNYSKYMHDLTSAQKDNTMDTLGKSLKDAGKEFKK